MNNIYIIFFSCSHYQLSVSMQNIFEERAIELKIKPFYAAFLMSSSFILLTVAISTFLYLYMYILCLNT